MGAQTERQAVIEAAILSAFFEHAAQRSGGIPARFAESSHVLELSGTIDLRRIAAVVDHALGPAGMSRESD